MVIAMDSSAVDALVFFVSEEEGKPVYFSGSMVTNFVAPSSGAKSKPLVAIQYKKEKHIDKIGELESEPTVTKVKEVGERSDTTEIHTPSSLTMPMKPVCAKKASNSISQSKMTPVVVEEKKEIKKPVESVVTSENSKDTNPGNETDTNESAKGPSALDYIKAIAENKWEYASLLDRYIVRYDKDTYIVLTIRPSLQKKLENIFKKYSTRIGASIIEDPLTGEILAMTSCHKNVTHEIEADSYKTDNWALKATFPVASIFKIITASAGIDTGKITPNSRFIAWRKSYMKVWKAFAKSHNGVFGKIARKVGKKVMEKYIDAYGFNKQFFFDLPVGKSIAKLPSNPLKMGQAAAGLNRDFLVSPIHVATIVSTILNRGKTMKPYLVDYVVRKNKVVFRRKPFQIAQPIKASTARDIYKMMYTTTAVGTGKKGFGGYRKYPNLAKICGGKTGTLTGASPNYLFTWFGGFTKATGRDLCIVTLVGQKNHSGTKAASIAGQIAYELALSHKNSKPSRMAAK